MPTTAEEQAPEVKARLKILVVEDEPIVRLAIRTVLERDYDILEAESISESLSIFERKKPDLITLDLYLPDVTGMQGLQQFRERSEKIPIIVISGHASFKLAQEALRLGATDYLTKPFTAKELLATVQSAFAKAEAHSKEALDLYSTDAAHALKLRIPLENLQDDKFLSSRHRAHFLAFAQNALSDKKRNFEIISTHELIKTVTLQFEALDLHENVACEVDPTGPKTYVDCDMYLLGGALANLVFICALETKNDKSSFTLKFNSADGKLQIIFQKSNISLPEDILARFKYWHEHPTTALDANTAMLIMAEHVIRQHQGELTLNTSSSAGPLLEIRLPLKQPNTTKSQRISVLEKTAAT